MISNLNIFLTSIPLNTGSDEEKAAFGQLQIKTHNQLLTEGADFSGKEVAYRPGPYISGYHLAEWLVWNWWRLRWEPWTIGQGPDRRYWDFAHCLATIGEGYVWPNITVSTDGFWTSLVSDRSSESAASLFRYSGVGFFGVPAADLESAIDQFVPQVVHMANNAGLTDTNLHRLWQDLQLEREDTEMARFRRFEALLGCDPDELDSDGIESRLGDANVLGDRALEEIAIGSASGATDLSGMLSAQQISEITKKAGFDINPEDGVSANVPELNQWGNSPAWRIGASAATAVRSQEHLGDGPLTDDGLARLAGTTVGVINKGKHGWRVLMGVQARGRISASCAYARNGRLGGVSSLRVYWATIFSRAVFPMVWNRFPLPPGLIATDRRRSAPLRPNC